MPRDTNATTMPSDRFEAAAALALAALATAAAAAAVDGALPTAVDRPTGGDAGGGPSLYALLVALLVRLFSLLGVELTVGGPPGDLSLLARLLRLLGAALPLLLGGAAVAAVAALAFEYREGLAGVVRRERGAPRRDEQVADDDRAWPPDGAGDPVSAAWTDLVAAVEQSSPRTRTPAEWRRAAVDAGLPQRAVDGVTDLFRATRYGDEPVTDERAGRAERLRRQLSTDGDGDDDG